MSPGNGLISDVMYPMANGVELLEREVYTEAEASRLLRTPQSTLHYWLEGGRRGRKIYLPIIRSSPTGSRVVTWGEFVEAGLLRQYRNERVPMPQLRKFIDTLRAELGVAYPLAHAQPWTSGRELLRTSQQVADLDQEFWLVSNAQLMLTFPGEAFLNRVRWEGPDGVVSGFRPSSEEASPVVIDPLVRFGRPSVNGVSTQAIFDEMESGASVAEASADFGLAESDVRWAYAYEATQAA